MSTISLIWIASGAGALLFFFSGYYLCRIRQRATAADLDSASGQAAEQHLAPLREKLTLARAREAEAGRAQERLQARVDELDDQQQRLQRQADETEAQLSEAERRADDAEHRAGELEQLADEGRGQAQELELAQRRLAELEQEGTNTLRDFPNQVSDAQPADDDPQEQGRTLRFQRSGGGAMRAALDTAVIQREEALTRLEQRREQVLQLQEQCALLEQDLRSLRQTAVGEMARATLPQWHAGEDSEALGLSEAELSELRTQLQDARARVDELEAAEGQLSDVQHQNEELARSLRSAEERIAELDAVDQERRLLEVRVRELEELANTSRVDEELVRAQEHQLQIKALCTEVDHLRRQVDMLQDENLQLRELRMEGEARGGQARRRATQPLPLTGATLQSQMDALVWDDKTIGAVLSDHNGLTVVQSGEHTEEMAAVAAHLTKVSNQNIRLLPLAHLSQLTLSDADELSMTVYPVGMDRDMSLLLALLSAGPGPTRNSLSEILDQALTLAG